MGGGPGYYNFPDGRGHRAIWQYQPPAGVPAIPPALNTDKAARYNAGKPRLGHIMDYPRAMQALAEVAEYGSHKYDRGNFQKGQHATVTLDSMFRHLFRWWCGEDKDPESGLDHLAHFLWNAIVLVEDMRAGREGDDDRTFLRPDLQEPI